MSNFNFKGIKFNLKDIQDYLNAQGVQLSANDKKNLTSIFNAADTYDDKNHRYGSDGKLNMHEVKTFEEKLKKSIPSLLKHIQAFSDGIANNVLNARIQKATTQQNDAITGQNDKYLMNCAIPRKKDDRIEKMVISEAAKRNKKLSEEDVKYWTDRISKIAEKYDIPDSLLVSIVGRETNFSKNINSSNGAGPMGVTTIAVKDFFPAKGNDWNEYYEMMDSELLNDILYKKDIHGNFIKDKNGKYVRKYNSPKELRDACAKDDELGMKVGLLSFEMDFVKAVAAYKNKKSSLYTSVPKTIEGIQNGSIKLTEAEIEKCMTEALKNYNSVFKTYAPAVVDSLKHHGLIFKDLYLIKNNKT